MSNTNNTTISAVLAAQNANYAKTEVSNFFVLDVLTKHRVLNLENLNPEQPEFEQHQLMLSAAFYGFSSHLWFQASDLDKFNLTIMQGETSTDVFLGSETVQLYNMSQLVGYEIDLNRTNQELAPLVQFKIGSVVFDVMTTSENSIAKNDFLYAAFIRKIVLTCALMQIEHHIAQHTASHAKVNSFVAEILKSLSKGLPTKDFYHQSIAVIQNYRSYRDNEEFKSIDSERFLNEISEIPYEFA